jgi:toxin ParE1/3/4
LGRTIEFSAAAERDFDLIFDFLFSQYVDFGEAPRAALEQAARRVRGIRKDADRLALAPFRGTLHDDVLPGLRHATLGKAIFWFDVDENAGRAVVLGVFYGGQERRIAMLRRLLEG